MRALGIVVGPPSRDLLACIAERAEPVRVQALIPELAIEALDEGVLDRLAGLDEAQAQAGSLRPVGGANHRLKHMITDRSVTGRRACALRIPFGALGTLVVAGHDLRNCFASGSDDPRDTAATEYANSHHAHLIHAETG